MKNFKGIEDFLNSLFFSWGSDPSWEVFYSANKFLDWIECEYDVILNIRFGGEDGDDNDFNFDGVLLRLKEIFDK